jgi:hypothetical protein
VIVEIALVEIVMIKIVMMIDIVMSRCARLLGGSPGGLGAGSGCFGAGSVAGSSWGARGGSDDAITGLAGRAPCRAGQRRKNGACDREDAAAPGGFAVEIILILVAFVAYMYWESVRPARPSEVVWPPKFVHSREWLGADPVEPLDHYYQIIKATDYYVTWREVQVEVAPDGKGGFYKRPVANYFLPGAGYETKTFFYDGSNNPPTMILPDGSIATPSQFQ